MRMPHRDAREREREDALGMEPRKTCRRDAAERVPREMQSIDRKCFEQQLERGSEVIRIRRLARRHTRLAVARRVPRDDAEVFREGLELVRPRARARTDTVEHDEWRTGSLIEIREAPPVHVDRADIHGV